VGRLTRRCSRPLKNAAAERQTVRRTRLTVIIKIAAISTVLTALLATTAWPQTRPTGREVSLPTILKDALSEVKSETAVPILLPSQLPSGLSEKEIHYVFGEGDKNHYKISLYFEAGIGDAGFAGYFGGEPLQRISSLGEEQKVPLANSIRGYYLEVSCGGSCRPATLMWELNGVLYTVQFKNLGKAALVAIANSAILAGKR
jgi:hypothetical protein